MRGIMTHCKNILLSLGKAWIMVLLIMIPLLGLTILYPNLMLHWDHIISQHELICTAFSVGNSEYNLLCMADFYKKIQSMEPLADGPN